MKSLGSKNYDGDLFRVLKGVELRPGEFFHCAPVIPSMAAPPMESKGDVGCYSNVKPLD